MFGEPGAEAGDSVLHAAVLPPRQADVEARRGQLAEFQDARPVRLGHAEDLADDRDGQLRAIASDDVDHAGLAGELLEQVGGRLLDALPQGRDRPGREHRRHGLAVAGVVGGLDGQQGGRAQGVQEVVASAALEPSQGCGQIRPENQHPEVVGPQQLVRECVIGRQVGDAAFDQVAAGPDFVVEAHRIGGHRRIGNQPGLDVTPAGDERRDAADEAMHREPVQSFLHRPSLAQVSLRA